MIGADETLLGAGVVAVFILLELFFIIRKAKAKSAPVFRRMAGAGRLRRAVGLAVEDGTRVHISLGSASLIDPSNSSALTALSALNRIEQLTSTSDLPPMCTSGNGGFQILSQDVLKQNTVETNRRDQLDPNLAHLSGATSFAYAIGTLDAMHESGTSTNVFLGSFGAEAGLICDAAEENQSYTLAGSNSIVGQAVFFAMADDPLIGEEIYALPAYLGAGWAHQASLRVQDIFRLCIILLLLGSLVLKVMNWL